MSSYRRLLATSPLAGTSLDSLLSTNSSSSTGTSLDGDFSFPSSNGVNDVESKLDQSDNSVGSAHSHHVTRRLARIIYRAVIGL